MSQDTQLISASLDGDTDAFGQLAFKYQDRLFNTLTYLLGSQEAVSYTHLTLPTTPYV